jgi:glycosyltransferase involved in cell wall biosynthesis
MASNATFRCPPPDGELEQGEPPTFSVIIPAYQAADTIGEAIESALGQTRPPLEIVVCDDGSTDGLESALEPFGEQIVVLHRQHRGAGAARNEALRAATGDFVALLDADDVFAPERLELLGELAGARTDLDILSTDAYFEVDGRVTGRFHELNAFAVENQRRSIVERCFIVGGAVRRSHSLDVGGFDESPDIAPAEDWDLLIRLILDGSRAGLVELPLLHYRKHPGAMTANRQRALRSRVAVLEKTARHPQLTPAERQLVERLRIAANARSALLEAEALAAGRRRGFRRQLFRIAADEGLPRSVRLKIAVLAITSSFPVPVSRRRATEPSDA